jgi:hypothetical protein
MQIDQATNIKPRAGGTLPCVGVGYYAQIYDQNGKHNGRINEELHQVNLEGIKENFTKRGNYHNNLQTNKYYWIIVLLHYWNNKNRSNLLQNNKLPV